MLSGSWCVLQMGETYLCRLKSHDRPALRGSTLHILIFSLYRLAAQVRIVTNHKRRFLNYVRV